MLLVVLTNVCFCRIWSDRVSNRTEAYAARRRALVAMHQNERLVLRTAAREIVKFIRNRVTIGKKETVVANNFF